VAARALDGQHWEWESLRGCGTYWKWDEGGDRRVKIKAKRCDDDDDIEEMKLRKCQKPKKKKNWEWAVSCGQEVILGNDNDVFRIDASRSQCHGKKCWPALHMWVCLRSVCRLFELFWQINSRVYVADVQRCPLWARLHARYVNCPG